MASLNRREARGVMTDTGCVFAWVAVAMILIGLLSAGAWALGVFTSGAKGSGDRPGEEVGSA